MYLNRKGQGVFRWCTLHRGSMLHVTSLILELELEQHAGCYFACEGLASLRLTIGCGRASWWWCVLCLLSDYSSLSVPSFLPSSFFFPLPPSWLPTWLYIVRQISATGLPFFPPHLSLDRKKKRQAKKANKLSCSRAFPRQLCVRAPLTNVALEMWILCYGKLSC